MVVSDKRINGIILNFARRENTVLFLILLSYNMNQNQNSLLVKRQTDNTTPGGWGFTGGDLSRALTREVNLDTQSSDNSAEDIRESGSSFQSLIVWGKNCVNRHLYLLKVSEMPISVDSYNAYFWGFGWKCLQRREFRYMYMRSPRVNSKRTNNIYLSSCK